MVYGPEILELYPWFADGSSGSFTLTTSQAHYGYFSTPSQNNALSWDVSLRPGTYTMTDLCPNLSSAGIASIANGGSTLGTLDKYAASTSYNQSEAATGLSLLSGEITQTAATKNASSSGYANPSTYSRLVRTGG